jgi:molecular chaperone DnaK (HSP70)
MNAKEIQAQIEQLESALEKFDDVEYGSWAHRQQDAIERKLEDLDWELKRLEADHYNALAEQYE